MSQEPLEGETSLTVFVSYSRQDSDIADSLVVALEREGFNVTIDRRDLPFGEEWQAELQDFIFNCDAVVWLVSPASIVSRWVNWELGEVQRAGKRLVPVVAQDIDRANLPETLGKIHLMPAEGVFDETAHLPVLSQTLNTDWSWLKESTRLGMMARTWAKADGGRDRLLRGKALRAAEEWISSRPVSAPVPATGILDFVAASQARAKRAQRSWIAGLSVTTVVLMALAIFAFVQRGIAIANERTAEERAARLSVPVAASLREEGFVPQGVLVLLEASRQFDVANAPANLKIEMERALNRAQMERARVLLPPETRIDRISDRLVARTLQGGQVVVPLLDAVAYQGTRSIPVDCAGIYNNPEFNFPWPEEGMHNRVPDPEYGFDDFGYKLTCTRQGEYVLLVQTYLGASGGTDSFAIFSLDMRERVFSMDQPIGEVAYDWIVGTGEDADKMMFASVDLRTITVRHFDYGFPGATQVLTADRELRTLKFTALDRLLGVTGIDYGDGSVSPGDRWVYDFDLNPENPFLEVSDFTGNPDLEIAGYDSSSSDLLHPTACDDEGSPQMRCETVSADGAWRLVRGIDEMVLYQTGQDTPVGTISRDWDQFDFVTFYRNGPELLMTDYDDPQSVHIWSPPASPQAAWTRALVYRGADDVNMVEADASGDRLSLVVSKAPKTIDGLIYSISAREVWRDLGGASPWGVVRELKDGRVMASYYEALPDPAIYRFAQMSELVTRLTDALPEDCRVTQPSTWRSTPCWPQWVD